VGERQSSRSDSWWLYEYCITEFDSAAEIHTSSRRAKGVAITTCSNWLNNFIIVSIPRSLVSLFSPSNDSQGLITPPMLQSISYGTFVFFGSFAVLAGLWTYFFVPETK
jgi:hypothetical protein